MFVYGPHVFESDEEYDYDSDCDTDLLLEVSRKYIFNIFFNFAIEPKNNN